MLDARGAEETARVVLGGRIVGVPFGCFLR